MSRRVSRRISRPVAIAALVGVLAAGACGGGGSITMRGNPSGSGGGGGGSDLCRGFDDPNGPSEELLSMLPDRFRPSVDAIRVFTGEGEDASAALFVDALAGDGVAENLRELAAFAEDECGPTEAGPQIAAIADAATMVREPEMAEYCAVLESWVADPDVPPTAERFAAARDVAPESHLEAIDLLEAMVTSAGPPAGVDVESSLGDLLGLGAYAEATCGIPDALAQFALAGAFMGMGGELGGGGAGAPDVTTTTIDLGAVQADPAAANAAAAAAGQGASFGPFPIQLDEDDPAYNVSAVVPAGWELDDGFGVEFSPPGDDISAMFTSIRFDTGCDGLCAPTDWEERVRSGDGAVGQFMANHPDAAERPVAGSAGVVVWSASPEDPAAKVIRWDDGTAKYFVCTVDLDDDTAGLLDALIAACESSRPAWIAVG